MNSIELVFATEQTFLNWKKEFTRKIFASPLVLPSGGEFLDVEQAISLMIPEDLYFSFSGNMSFTEARRKIINEFWPRSIAYRDNPSKTVPPYDQLYLSTPAIGYISREEENKTLTDLGFRSGDLVVVEWQEYPAAMISGRMHPRELPTDLKSFFAAVTDDLRKSRQLLAWDGEYNPSPVGALLLYTDEDVELATYVRRYYASLHIMSGFDLTFYFLEYIPKNEDRQRMRSFWNKRLPRTWYSVWSALGFLRSKPFPAREVYGFADELGIEPDRLPCMVLFNDWRKIRDEKLVVRIADPLPQFFRRSCSDVHRAILAMKGMDHTPTPDIRPSIKSGVTEVTYEMPEKFSFSRVIRRSQLFLSADARPLHLSKPNLSDAPSHEPSWHLPFPEFVSRLPTWWTADEKQYSAGSQKQARSIPGKPSVFLCHSSRDKPFVERLALDLRKLGTGIWLDKREITVGDSILERIEEGIANNDFLFIILSPDSVSSPWVRRELNAATIRELDERRVIVVPILYRAVEIPLLIRDKLYADFTASYEEGLKTLVSRLFPDAVDCLDAINAIQTPAAGNRPQST